MEASGYFRYPRTVNVDFTKLDREALLKVIKYYGAVPPHAVSDLDLACVAARYFEAHTALENEIVDDFSKRFCHTDSDSKKARKPHPNSKGGATIELLRAGEQAAAKISKSDEGSWILVNVLYYDATADKYDVQDEDDHSRVMKLEAGNVRKLGDFSASLRRGDQVLAVFPETTSFYRGIVAKHPKASTGTNGNPEAENIIVRFDDDEDDQGKPVARKVPSRFVLPLNYSTNTEANMDD